MVQRNYLEGKLLYVPCLNEARFSDMSKLPDPGSWIEILGTFVPLCYKRENLRVVVHELSYSVGC
jgi:hypothetical protein